LDGFKNNHLNIPNTHDRCKLSVCPRTPAEEGIKEELWGTSTEDDKEGAQPVRVLEDKNVEQLLQR